MACQSDALLEDAPTESVVICFSSSRMVRRFLLQRETRTAARTNGIRCHLLFLLKDGSTVSLAKRDLTDVGISGSLQTGFGFFGLLHAASASLPCGRAATNSVARRYSVSMFCIRYGMDLDRK